jgi:transcriptional regulator with XRE-family HTH domain
MSAAKPSALRSSTSPLAVQVGERIRDLRRIRRWTQRELAGRAGLSSQRLSKYERGDHAPPLRTLMRIARAFGILVDGLLPAPFDAAPGALEERFRDRLLEAALLGDREKEALLALLEVFFALLALAASRAAGAAGPPYAPGGPKQGAHRN